VICYLLKYVLIYTKLKTTDFVPQITRFLPAGNNLFKFCIHAAKRATNAIRARLNKINCVTECETKLLIILVLRQCCL